jgi:CheY-like chemotaxis protein
MLATISRVDAMPAALHASFAAGGTSPSVMQGMAVLLADDDPHVRSWLRRELEDSLASTVVEAADGGELEDRLNERRFDLVVSDVQMPVATGIAVAQRLRRQGSDTPFVFITGSTSGALRACVRRLGRAAVLAKPFEIEELERAARRLLAGCG